MNRLALLFAVGLTASALGMRAEPPSAPAQQDAPPTFRAGVEIVDVDVSVLDKHRQPVTGLTAADFTVLEDGKPRPIVAFTPVALASRELTTAKWMSEVGPDVLSNDLQREGRLIAVLMDRSIGLADVTTARAIAEGVIEQLRPADLAAIVYTEYGVPQNFTADRRRLLAAIRQPSVGLPEGDRGQTGSCFCGICTLDRITDIATAVRDVRQRRKLLFVVGSNIPITSRGGCSGTVAEARTNALKAIGAANLTVYVLDPSGLPTLAGNAASATPPSGRSGMANLIRIGNLMVLPDETGGRAIVGNDPAEKLPELFRESNSYYVLGFRPAHADGRQHDISVKLSRRDVILQARRGYYAAGGKPPRPATAPPKGVPPDLYSAIAGLWPKSDLPLTISATPVAMPGLRAGAVALMIGVAESPRTPGGGGPPRETTTPVPLNVLVGAFDRNGRVLAYEQGVASLPPIGTRDTGWLGSLMTRLELKPGKYELRAAVHDPASGETGSVYTYVDVPNYLTEFVSLSGILLYTNPAESTGLLNGALRAPLPAVPTIRREFARGERITAWLQIYEGIARAAMPGYVLTEIRDDTDTRVFHQETRTLVTDVGANRAITLNFDLPLTNLSPGQYVLSVEVKQGNANTKKEVRFAIR